MQRCLGFGEDAPSPGLCPGPQPCPLPPALPVLCSGTASGSRASSAPSAAGPMVRLLLCTPAPRRTEPERGGRQLSWLAFPQRRLFENAQLISQSSSPAASSFSWEDVR